MNLWLAYIPFLDPLPIDPFWLLLMIPLVVLVSAIYKTIRVDDLATLPREAMWMSIQIIAFMIVAAMVVWAMTETIG